MKSSHGSKGIFVTGTDTGVGKTWVTAGIAGALIRRGHSLGVWKPAQSGVQLGHPDADSYQLKQWSGADMDEREIATYTLSQPVAPALAAELEGSEIEIPKLLKAHDELSMRFAQLLIEGAGGIAVPLGRDFLIADLAKALGHPIIIVARPNLGTVNHTLLTISYARQMGLEILGVILNGYPQTEWMEREATTSSDSQAIVEGASASLDASLRHNAEWIEKLSGVKVIGKLPRLKYTPTREQWLDIIEKHIHMDVINEHLGGNEYGD
jgi:dethiobiotin synthetase